MMLQRTPAPRSASLRLLQQFVRYRTASTAAVQALQLPHRLVATAVVPHHHQQHARATLSSHRHHSWSRAFCSSTDSSSDTSSTESVTTILPKSPKDELFLRALQTYYQREGHFSVPNEFVIPSSSSSSDSDASDTNKPAWPENTHGMDLGRRLRLFTRGRCGEYKRSVLKGIGFPYDDWRTYVWEQQILPALATFYALEGHLFVRQAFSVPTHDDRWPRSTWGFKLGSHCQLLRREKERTPPEQIATLDALGFMWSELEWKRQVYLLPALTTFQRLYGHCDVPDKFVVPADGVDVRWPPKTWGYRLGRMLAAIRDDEAVASVGANGAASTASLPPAHRKELEALGVFDRFQSTRVWRDRMQPALETFVCVYRHADIPADFVVPFDNDAWPLQTHGLALGDIVTQINAVGLFRDAIEPHKTQLQALGFKWDALFGRWAKQLLPALQQFYHLYDHCDVPQMFIVPSNDPQWPPETFGYRLGKQVSLLRRSGRDAKDVAEVLPALDAMHFSFNVIESAFVEKVLPALEVYAAQYGDCNVPQGFVVPIDDPTWPKRSWGIKLGHIIRNIRGRKQHAEQVNEHRERLAELGFVWRLNQNVEATNRDVVKPYLAIFATIYGDATPEHVPRDFVVPFDDARWPEAARGFKLGDWLYRYHQRDAGLLPFQTKEGRVASQKRQRLKASGMLGGGGGSATHAAAAQSGLSPFQDAYWRDVLLAAFHAYASLHDGSCAAMDAGFVVPSHAPFPAAAFGLNLGLRIRHIRHGERYAEEVAKYRTELETLGVLLPEPEVSEEEEEEDEEAEEEEVDNVERV